MFRFEKLDVWNRSVTFAHDVYRMTRTFPESERFGLISQMRRAAVAVAGNIAEGCGRTSDRDYARFLDIAYGSLMETLSHATIARNEQFLLPTDYQKLFQYAEEIAKMLSGLRTHLRSRNQPS